ncbi:hypothetical protein [Mailhella sp.]
MGSRTPRRAAFFLRPSSSSASFSASSPAFSKALRHAARGFFFSFSSMKDERNRQIGEQAPPFARAVVRPKLKASPAPCAVLPGFERAFSCHFCSRFSFFSLFSPVLFLHLSVNLLDLYFAFVQNEDATQGRKADSARRSSEAGAPCLAAPASTELGKPQTAPRNRPGGKAFDGREGGLMEGG